jgi:hypothetical protein
MSPAAAITGSAADAVAGTNANTIANSTVSRMTAGWTGAGRAKKYILYGLLPLRTAHSVRVARFLRAMWKFSRVGSAVQRFGPPANRFHHFGLALCDVSVYIQPV